MPRKPIDYAKCMFYRLVCRDITVTEVYVGHTTNEVDRRATHKSCCTNEEGETYNLFVYRFIRDHGNWDNWQLIVHEKLAVKDKSEAVLRERFWCEHYQATLNSNVPGRTRKESCANWHANHRDEQKEYRAKYHVEHREEHNKMTAAWILAHEVQRKEKHTCACGGKYTTSNRSCHLKSKKHLASL